MLAIQESLSINCLFIDDICGSLFGWCKNNESRNIQWNTSSIFTRRYTSLLFESLNNSIPYDIVPIRKLQAWIVTSMPHINLFEAIFVPGNKTIMLEWLENILCYLFGLVNNTINIDRATLWMSVHSYKTVHDLRLNNMVEKYITCDWIYSIQFYSCLQFGERIDANRVAIQLSPDHSNGNTHIQQFKNYSSNPDTDVYGFVDSVDSTRNINHSEDIIEMKNYYFESGSDVFHSLTSLRVIGIVSDTETDTSTLHTYRK